MNLGSGFAGTDLGGDLLVKMAGYYQSHDFSLPRSQAAEPLFLVS
jgi:hypothetical protein